MIEPTDLGAVLDMKEKKENIDQERWAHNQKKQKWMILPFWSCWNISGIMPGTWKYGNTVNGTRADFPAWVRNHKATDLPHHKYGNSDCLQCFI